MDPNLHRGHRLKVSATELTKDKNKNRPSIRYFHLITDLNIDVMLVCWAAAPKFIFLASPASHSTAALFEPYPARSRRF